MSSGIEASCTPRVTDARDTSRAPDLIYPVNLGGTNPKPEEIGTTESYIDPVTEDTFFVRTRCFDRSVYREVFYDAGRTHRIGAPAIRYFYPTGELRAENYYRMNTPHRVDGPAVIEYREDGRVNLRSYRIEGLPVDGAVDLVRSIRKYLDPVTVHEELAAGHLGHLLAAGHTPDALLAIVGAGLVTTEGVEAVLDGAPVEWAIAFEAGR